MFVSIVKSHHIPPLVRALTLMTATLMILFTGHFNTAYASEEPRGLMSTPPMHSIVGSLTDAEKLYLRNKSQLTMVCDPAWPPFDYIDHEGRHSGIAADILTLVSERIETKIKLIPTSTWAKSVDEAKAGRCDLVSMLNKTPERSAYLDFTSPFMNTPVVIIGKEGKKLPNGLEDIRGKTMAVVKGYRMEEDLRRDYPGIHLITTRTTDETLRMVADGEVFATISTAIEATHLIRKKELFGLKTIGQTQYAYKYSVGVQKGDTLLLSIMDKAIRSLSDSEKQDIINKWISLPEKKSPDSSRGWWILGALLSVSFFVFVVFRQRQ